MNANQNIIEWLSNWFKSNCDGFWEHDNILQITTTDNPGWYFKVDLEETKAENLKLELEEKEGDDDWYFLLIENKQFKAAGDLSKLDFLLNRFKQLIEGLD